MDNLHRTIVELRTRGSHRINLSDQEICIMRHLITFALLATVLFAAQVFAHPKFMSKECMDSKPSVVNRNNRPGDFVPVVTFNYELFRDPKTVAEDF